MRRNLYILFAVCIICIAAITSCGTRQEDAAAQRVHADWEQGFHKGNLKKDGNDRMYALDYRKLNHEHPKENNLPRLHVVRTLGNDYVDFTRYYLDERTEYYLETIPMGGGETSYINIHPKSWGIESNEIWGFDVMGGNYYFLVAIYDESEPKEDDVPEQLRIVETDGKGRLQMQADILPGLKELGYGGILLSFCVDGDGYIYVTTMDEGKGGLYVTDGKGTAVASYICRVAFADIIFSPVKDDSGRIFFPVKDSSEQATRLLWKNGKNEIAELCRMENAGIDTWYCMRESKLYYVELNMIVRWDVITGKREEVFDLEENGIAERSCTTLLWDDSGNLYLRYISKSEDWVSRMSYEEPESKDSIDIGITTWGRGANFIKSELATYKRENPQCPLKVEDTVPTDNSKERMLVDVITGKGPDMLYVSYRDLLRLNNNGALREIEGLLPEAVKATLLPGVIEYGEIEDGLYGIPVCVQMQTMFTNRNIWNGKGWTLDEALEAAENNPAIHGIFTAQTGYGLNEYDTLRLLVEPDIAQEKSKFIDWEKRTSHFEEKNFMRVLETVKNYEEQRTGKEADEDYGIAMQSALGMDSSEIGIGIFSILSSKLGEDCYAVGLPAEDHRGNYLIAEGLFVVNVNVEEEKLKTIGKLIEYFLGMECQQKIWDDISVIDGLIDTHIKYSEIHNQYYWDDGTDVKKLLSAKKDGTPYTGEFRELLRSAVPYKDYCPIYDIVAEEAGAFWSGQKDATEVTRLIDRRVQLYLDENK